MGLRFRVPSAKVETLKYWSPPLDSRVLADPALLREDAPRAVEVTVALVTEPIVLQRLSRTAITIRHPRI